jgi:ABC-type lipoprotein export system ATPase subunit
MSTELKNATTASVQKPQVFLKSITFNDDTQLPLNHNSVIVFTGANNSGKSQVLRDTEAGLDKSNSSPTIVIKDIEYDFIGTIDEAAFLRDRFNVDQKGNYQLFETARHWGADYGSQCARNVEYC